MKNKNIEFKQSGLKCDNPKCNWIDETIKHEDYIKYVNTACPKCGENVLTEEDFNSSQFLIDAIDYVNTLNDEELKSLSSIFDIETLKESSFLKDAEGLDILDNSKEEDKVSIEFSSRGKIKVTKIKKI